MRGGRVPFDVQARAAVVASRRDSAADDRRLEALHLARRRHTVMVVTV